MVELAVRPRDVEERADGTAGEEADPARLTVWLTAIVVGVVLVAQIPIAIGLMHVQDAWEAYHATSVLIVNAALAAVTVLAAAVLPPGRRVLALLPGALVAGAMLAATVTFGGHAWDVTATLCTATGAWWIGRALLRVLRARALEGVVIVELVLGLAVLGLAVLALGRLGAIAWWSTGVPVLALGAAGAWTGARVAWTRRSAAWTAVTGSPLRAACAGLLLLQLGWAIVWLSAPDIMFDALSVKGYLPELWARTGSIGTLLAHPIMSNTGIAEIVAVPGHALAAPNVGRGLQMTALIVLVSTIWWWGRRSPAGPLAALLVGIGPQVVWQSTTAYDDLLLALGAVALALAVLRTAEPAGDAPAAGTPTLGTALAVGALAGACIWLKLSLLAIATVMAAGWVLLGAPGRTLRRRAAGVVLGALVIAGPGFALRWIDTGSPVFPLYNTIFKSPYYPLVDERYDFPYWPHATTLDALRTPYEVVVHPSVINPGTAPGSFGIVAAALTIAMLIGWRGAQGWRRSAWVVWAALLVSLLVWWSEFRYLRYLLPAGLVAVALVVTQLRGWRPGRTATSALLLAALGASIFHLPATVATYWNVPHRNLPFAAAFGRWSSQDYLHTVFPEKDVLDAFQRLSPPHAHAISDASEAIFVLGRDESAAWETERLMEVSGPPPRTGDDAFRRLRTLGIQWAILNTAQDTVAAYPWFASVMKHHSKLVLDARGWRLYRLVR